VKTLTAFVAVEHPHERTIKKQQLRSQQTLLTTVAGELRLLTYLPNFHSNSVTYCPPAHHVSM
jgi:hypothetical protein